MFPARNALLTACLVFGSASLVSAAPAEKRIYRVDSVIATLRNGTVTVQVKGAVQSGGWKGARLKLERGDARTLVVQFVAQPPPPGTPVIAGLLPVTANARLRPRRGVVAVRAQAEANEVTTQILH